MCGPASVPALSESSLALLNANRHRHTRTPESRSGNQVTAVRWANILRKIGHRVVISQQYNGEEIDLLVALHARKSFDSIDHFRRAHSGRPLIVALTGTDVRGKRLSTVDGGHVGDEGLQVGVHGLGCEQ